VQRVDEHTGQRLVTRVLSLSYATTKLLPLNLEAVINFRWISSTQRNQI
jgi:hypothetical protein